MLLGALVGDPSSAERCRARLRADPWLHAPHLIDLEFVSGLRRLVARRAVSSRRAATALDDLGDLPLTRYPHGRFLRRIWELRRNLTPYDAAYVALGEILGCPVVTADRGLATAPGTSCEIELISP